MKTIPDMLDEFIENQERGINQRNKEKIMKKEEMYDVVAVNIDSNIVEALFGENKTLENAEAIVSMAVMRRGIKEQFYSEVPHGSLKVGDKYSKDAK